MRRLDLQTTPPPLADISFKSLYVKEIYDAPTRDGWVLQISRYRAIRQQWDQPILDQPLLLVVVVVEPPGGELFAGRFEDEARAVLADAHDFELRRVGGRGPGGEEEDEEGAHDGFPSSSSRKGAKDEFLVPFFASLRLCVSFRIHAGCFSGCK